MSNETPSSSAAGRENRVCPVCGQVSYSRGGVHPQCSVKQADDERVARQKTLTSQEETKTEKKLSRWQKLCPKCGATLHVRKKNCDCGQVFGG